jgi:hypothetical protein
MQLLISLTLSVGQRLTRAVFISVKVNEASVVHDGGSAIAAKKESQYGLCVELGSL